MIEKNDKSEVYFFIGRKLCGHSNIFDPSVFTRLMSHLGKSKYIKGAHFI